MPKIGGKEYTYRIASLESMRQCAKLERKIAAVDSIEMIDDDKVFHHLISMWREMLGIMLVDGSEIKAGEVPSHELVGVNKGFFNQGTPTK